MRNFGAVAMLVLLHAVGLRLPLWSPVRRCEVAKSCKKLTIGAAAAGSLSGNNRVHGIMNPATNHVRQFKQMKYLARVTHTSRQGVAYTSNTFANPDLIFRSLPA